MTILYKLFYKIYSRTTYNHMGDNECKKKSAKEITFTNEKVKRKTRVALQTSKALQFSGEAFFYLLLPNDYIATNAAIKIMHVFPEDNPKLLNVQYKFRIHANTGVLTRCENIKFLQIKFL